MFCWLGCSPERERGCGLPTPPRRALLGEFMTPAPNVKACAPGVAAAIGPGDTGHAREIGAMDTMSLPVS